MYRRLHWFERAWILELSEVPGISVSTIATTVGVRPKTAAGVITRHLGIGLIRHRMLKDRQNETDK